eukprot:s2126_g5.t1
MSELRITVEVRLLSGKAATVEAGWDELIGTLKRRAQTALEVGRGRLLDASGSVLDVHKSIKHARLQDRGSLTLHINRVQVQANGSAFAAILGDGSVVTWGHESHGGDSSAVQDQLEDVQQIQAMTRNGTIENGFAAFLGNGSVVIWGYVDCNLLRKSLKNVRQIQTTKSIFRGAFAAILDDGSVVAWGEAQEGGDSSVVQDQLNNVQQIHASTGAFAAILDDGSVVTWGDASRGGDGSAVQDQLKNVQQIQASFGAFAAIRVDGSVVTWGSASHGGDSSAVQDQLTDVQQIQTSGGAFAAILLDGSVVTWGDPQFGGDSRAVRDRLKNVRQIQATKGFDMGAFAGILDDGSVVAWGDASRGGDSSAVQDQLKNVQQIQASNFAFAAIRLDGSVVTWGSTSHGGNSSAVQDQLTDVHQIQASNFAFAVIRSDGSVVTWGSASHGGNSSSVQDQLKNVQQIQASFGAFAAILGDGSVVTWGDPQFGCDSSAVRDQLKNVHFKTTIEHLWEAEASQSIAEEQARQMFEREWKAFEEDCRGRFERTARSRKQLSEEVCMVFNHVLRQHRHADQSLHILELVPATFLLNSEPFDWTPEHMAKEFLEVRHPSKLRDFAATNATDFDILCRCVVPELRKRLSPALSMELPESSTTVPTEDAILEAIQKLNEALEAEESRYLMPLTNPIAAGHIRPERAAAGRDDRKMNNDDEELAAYQASLNKGGEDENKGGAFERMKGDDPNWRVKTQEGQATLADIKKRRRDELEEPGRWFGEAQEEGVSKKFKIVNFTSEDSAVVGEKTIISHYCAVCGTHCDKAFALEEAAHFHKKYATFGERILLKRPNGVEKQYRFYCRKCGSPLGYRTRPETETSKFSYFYHDALVDEQLGVRLQGGQVSLANALQLSLRQSVLESLQAAEVGRAEHQWRVLQSHRQQTQAEFIEMVQRRTSDAGRARMLAPTSS